MVRFDNEQSKLVIELNLRNFDPPKCVRNHLLKSILFIIGHLDDDTLAMVHQNELSYLCMLAEGLVSEADDNDSDNVGEGV